MCTIRLPLFVQIHPQHLCWSSSHGQGDRPHLPASLEETQEWDRPRACGLHGCHHKPWWSVQELGAGGRREEGGGGGGGKERKAGRTIVGLSLRWLLPQPAMSWSCLLSGRLLASYQLEEGLLYRCMLCATLDIIWLSIAVCDPMGSFLLWSSQDIKCSTSLWAVCVSCRWNVSDS